MEVTFYGTRGSVAISGRDHVKYGGRTTCVRIDSECLPLGHWLVVDGGTGIYPLGREADAAGVKEISLLFSHYHDDHTEGLKMARTTFNPNVKMSCYGVPDQGWGPKEQLYDLMKRPRFPKNFAEYAHHFEFHSVKDPMSYVIVIHPHAGAKVVEVDKFRLAEKKGSHQIALNGGTYDIAECLVIWMVTTNHPDRTVSYRFEERPTGKVMVFLTDHENTDAGGLSNDIRNHAKGADLLVMDSAYTREKYNGFAAGFGHATPDYCVRVAKAVDAKVLGLTHHDPDSTDDDIDSILATAKLCAFENYNYAGDIFACADDQVIKV